MRAAMMVALLGAAVVANDAFACDGSTKLLSVKDWTVEEVDGLIPGIHSGIDITVDIKSHAEKPFRMIDASYTFADALGRRISGFMIDPDLKVRPGETVSTTNGYTGSEMDRVIKMNRDDVIVTICTRAVVYEDGTKEDFS